VVTGRLQWSFLLLTSTHARKPISHAQALPRNIRSRTDKFDKNITKRGNVPVKTKSDDDFPVSKWLIGFFIVVVVGSSLVEIFNLFPSMSRCKK